MDSQSSVYLDSAARSGYVNTADFDRYVAAGIYFYPVCGQGKLLQIFFDRIEGLGPRIVSWLTRDQPKTSFWTHFDRYRPGIFGEAVSILKHRHHRWLRLQQWVQSIGHDEGVRPW